MAKMREPYTAIWLPMILAMHENALKIFGLSRASAAH
jgi:hypothetical protein